MVNEKKLNSGYNIVFQKKKYCLESAVSFYQHIVRSDRIITMIGELHNKCFQCNSPPKSTMTISQYCTQAVESNPRCRVILEYYKDIGDGKTKSDNPWTMNSHGIKKTFESIQQIGKEDQIIPLDYRPTFLTRKGQDALYGNTWWNEKKRTKNIDDIYSQIQKAFIDPFTKSVDKFGIKHPNQYSPTVKNFMDFYFENMVNEFQKIIDSLKKKKSIDDIRYKLFDAWKLVADYFIIKKILKEEPEINEYIIILGQAHLLNIQSVFKNKNFSSLITELVKPKKGKKGNCVQINLFEPLTF